MKAHEGTLSTLSLAKTERPAANASEMSHRVCNSSGGVAALQVTD